MKGNLLILVGISGSGKSTYAHELWKENPDKYVIVNRDKIRELLFGFTEAQMDEYYRLPKLGKYEKQVTRYADTLINDGLNHGKTVIVDATNLTIKYLNSYKYWNVPVDVKVFSISLEDAIQRDLTRNRVVGQAVIEKQYARLRSLTTQLLHSPIDFEPVTFDMNRDNTPCFIFDIDGTLAHMNRETRSPYNWKKVGEDTVDIPTERVLSSISDSSCLANQYGLLNQYEIIICTGRDGVCLPETLQWLDDNKIPHSKVMIRPVGDQRPDWIVKEEMWREIAEDYYIMGMFDDRLQVVRRARALGLKVFNVEYNNF